MASSPVIDIHCHVAGIGAGGSGCFLSSAMQQSWKTRFYFKAFGVSEPELTSPWLQLFSLGFKESRRLAAIANSWDRDVALNLALGLPEQVLTRAAGMLRLSPD